MSTTREARGGAKPDGSAHLYQKLSPGPGMSAAEVAEHQRMRIHEAVLDIVGERGYEAVTARELARLAGVSTRSFYQHFSSKEECFLRTQEVIARRLVRRLITAEAIASDWRERIRLIIASFLRGLERDPRAARLILVEAHGAGPAALGLIRRTNRTLEERIAENFTRDTADAEMPQLAVKGIVAGLNSVARSRVLAGSESELPKLAGDLAEWALAFRGDAAAIAAELDRRHARGNIGLAKRPPGPSSALKGGRRARSPSDDRALILSAVMKLAVAGGCQGLTQRLICDTAGVRRKSFAACFDSVEACFAAAVEERVEEALDEASRAQAEAPTWATSVRRAAAAICAQVAADRELAGLCLAELSAAGTSGIECQDRLTADLAARIRSSAPPQSDRPDELSLEASVGAAWGVLHHRLAAGEAVHIPATLSYILLAPIGDGWCRS